MNSHSHEGRGPTSNGFGHRSLLGCRMPVLTRRQRVRTRDPRTRGLQPTVHTEPTSHCESSSFRKLLCWCSPSLRCCPVCKRHRRATGPRVNPLFSVSASLSACQSFSGTQTRGHCQAGVAQRMANPRPRSQAFRTADRFGSRGVGREQRLRHRSVRLPPAMAPRRYDPPAGSSQTMATPPAGGGVQDPHRRSALTASVSVRPTP